MQAALEMQATLIRALGTAEVVVLVVRVVLHVRRRRQRTVTIFLLVTCEITRYSDSLNNKSSESNNHCYFNSLMILS